MRNDFCHFWEAIVLKDYDLMKKYSAKLNVKGEISGSSSRNNQTIS